MNKEQLLPLINQGLNQSEIASTLDCSRGTVQYWLRKYKLSILNEARYRRPVIHKCKKCGETNPNLFYKYNKSLCRKCKDSHNGARRDENRKKLNAWKEQGCILCGYNKCTEALEFHHIDSESKDKRISKSLVALLWSQVEQELRKCVVLCSNCHREVHAGVTSLLVTPEDDD